MDRLKTCVLLVFLAGAGWAQPPQLSALRQLLQSSRNQPQNFSSQQQILLARLELMQVQVEGLLQNKGDWNSFFRFYQVTQQQAQRLSPLQPAWVAEWERLQNLMSELARQRGVELPPLQANPVVAPAASADSKMMQPRVLQQALQESRSLQNSLKKVPPGADQDSFQEALDDLTDLRQALSQALNGGGASRVVRARRQFQLSRSALQLAPARFWALDRALDQIGP